MTNEEVIAKLVKENYELNEQNNEYKECLESIHSSFYSIGGPLNDNVLQFNNKQLKYIRKLKEEMEGVIS